ncbi:MAG: phospholipase D family protein [Rhodocyclaceae bacterium]|nr:phospholipase D family protein [Rhodocyclaceae bacterium]
MASRFLFNASLWAELEKRVPKSKKVEAAIAYLGEGGAALLPLRRGDRLVVDMSLPRVRAGNTDPREVRKLLRRGVEVYSRASLHAKFLILDGTVLAGSANITKSAKERLDEAAILTDDPAAVRRARAIFEQLCTEPVRKDYLEVCLREYRPPSFGGKAVAGPRRGRKPVQAKLWLIAGLRYRDVPDSELELAEKSAAKVEPVQAFERSELRYLHYPAEQKFFRRLRAGDWAIRCFSDGRGISVWPPARFLGHDSYRRDGGKRRHLLHFEEGLDAEPMSWTALRKAAPGIRTILGVKPRTKPIPRDAEADAILQLWDLRGRFRRKRK